MKIGIPRALLYYHYKTLWKTFFTELGFEVVVSPISDKEILNKGSYYSIDEACLSSKLYMGHVAALEGKCDAVFVPRIANYGQDGIFCSRFEALYDMVVNTFRETSMRFICCDVDLHQKKSESQAFIKMGTELGKSKEASARAYAKAASVWLTEQLEKADRQSELLDTDEIKILVVGHSYNLHDGYIGVPIMRSLKELGAIPLSADEVNLAVARQKSVKLCKNVPWMMSRELLGAVEMYREKIDGIVLITAFPCGPDSMVNEMIIRRIKDKPILNLLLDSQDGTAGIETRLESFVDIIRFRKEAEI